MKWLVFLFLTSLYSMSWGQVKLRISAPDSLSFFAIVNENPINSRSITDITWTQNELGKIKFKISFESTSFNPFEQIIELKSGNFYQFEIRKIKNKLLLFEIAESKYDFIVVKTDSMSLAKEEKEVFYTGQTQCESPLKLEEFEALKNRMTQSRFESQKVEELKKIVLLECLNVDQLRTLLSYLELEDNKIKLLEQAKPKIYDIDRSNLFIQDFLLERNKNRVKVLFQ